MNWWRQLRNNSLARLGASILMVLYLLVIGADFVAPYAPCDNDTTLRRVCQPQVDGALLPPTRIYWQNQAGEWLGPHVYPTTYQPINWQNKNSESWQTGL
ncbi:MAG: ABC transporter permease, partial [Acaryochloridaceae cyanobacterium SU_2_1]|nr:ABC transporter permease [Acaryochloridaceae cyanobacterium SU_2_1]